VGALRLSRPPDPTLASSAWSACAPSIALEKKQLVDRAPDITGRAWRSWLTRPAEALLRERAAGIEAASWFNER
jgi:hypothetical protein